MKKIFAMNIAIIHIISIWKSDHKVVYAEIDIQPRCVSKPKRKKFFIQKGELGQFKI